MEMVDVVTANDDAAWWGARVSNIDGTASSYELQRACAWVIYFALQLTENRARNIRPLASKGARLATTVRLSLSPMRSQETDVFRIFEI